MKYPCKEYPTNQGDADWCPVLSIRISNPAKHSPPSRRFEAIIDTGASRCIFHSSLGRAVGFHVEKGEEEQTIGVTGQPIAIYVHRVSIHAGNDILTVKAAFCEQLPLAGLLGRRGFLDQFKFTYDPSPMPPMFDIERIHRV